MVTLFLIRNNVTTLYFKSSKTDELREPGFSKDGKTAESQVVLGLLVSEGGYPLSYSLFNRSQYEGYTMIPIIDDFKQRFSLGKDFIVVADSELMNSTNVELLRKSGYKYVIGARIKNEGQQVKNWMLEQSKENNRCHEYKRTNGERLILHYSQTRAKKDSYNKFLEISKDIEVVISEQKIAEDSKWDGLKGYITNTHLNADVGKVLDAAKTITTIRVKLPENGEFYTKTLFLTDKHREIQPLFEPSDGKIDRVTH